MSPFAVARDAFALAEYRQRWPILRRRAIDLRRQIKQLTGELDERHLNELQRDRGGPWYSLQDTVSEMDQIEQDVKVRQVRLQEAA